MELTIYEDGKHEIIRDISVIKKVAETSFLHIALVRCGKTVLLDSIKRKLFVMDKDAFNQYGKNNLASMKMLPFFKTPKGFLFVAPTVTSRCNMRCDYCFGFGGEEFGKKSSWDIIKSSIDLAARTEGSKIYFFAPGEVTLNPSLMNNAVDYAMKKGLAPGNISSNGVISLTTIDKSLDCGMGLQISIDGPPEIQNRQRPLKDGKKSSVLVEDNIKDLVTRKKMFHTSSVITENHWNSEEYTARYFADLGIVDVGLANVNPTGFGQKYSGQNTEKVMLSKMKINEFLDLLGIESRPTVDVLLGSSETKFCPQGYSLHVSADGNLASCPHVLTPPSPSEMDAKEKMTFGKYDQTKKRFIIDQKKLDSLRNFYKSADCQNCDNKLCWGGCPHKNLLDTGDTSKVSQDLCRSRGIELKLYLKYLAERYVIGLKPLIAEKKGKLFLSTIFSELEIFTDFTRNPFIELDIGREDFDVVFDKIISFKERFPRNIAVALLSPSRRGISQERSIELREFLYGLKEKNVLFRVTKPIDIQAYGETDKFDMHNDLRIPASCMDCLEMFRIVDGKTVFCNGKYGPMIENVFDRKEMYRAFLASGSNHECQCSDENFKPNLK